MAIFGGEAFGVGGERDDYFDAERTEDADLFVGPICADGGLHDVQDLHGGGYSNPERLGRGGKIARGEFEASERLARNAGKMPARHGGQAVHGRVAKGVAAKSRWGRRGESPARAGRRTVGLKLYGQSCVAVVNKQAAGGGE